MEIEDLPEDHSIGERKRELYREHAGEEAASRFEARYIQLLEEGASKIEAADIASMEILADRAEKEAERIGDGFDAVDGLRHENEQWREMAGVSPPDES
jgi:hypothetical protein